MARRPAENAFGFAVRDPPVLRIEGAGCGRQCVRRKERRQLDPEQLSGIGDDIVLGRGQVVRDVVGAGRRVKAGQHGADDVIDMDAAEHLARGIDPIGCPGRDPVERRAAGTVDPGQAEDPGAQAEPVRVRRGA